MYEKTHYIAIRLPGEDICFVLMGESKDKAKDSVSLRPKKNLVNLHGLTPVVSRRPKGRVQAALALNLLFLDFRYTAL